MINIQISFEDGKIKEFKLNKLIQLKIGVTRLLKLNKLIGLTYRFAITKHVMGGFFKAVVGHFKGPSLGLKIVMRSSTLV